MSEMREMPLVKVRAVPYEELIKHFWAVLGLDYLQAA
jgi:hypothetical protein